MPISPDMSLLFEQKFSEFIFSFCESFKSFVLRNCFPCHGTWHGETIPRLNGAKRRLILIIKISTLYIKKIFIHAIFNFFQWPIDSKSRFTHFFKGYITIRLSGRSNARASFFNLLSYIIISFFFLNAKKNFLLLYNAKRIFYCFIMFYGLV